MTELQKRILVTIAYFPLLLLTTWDLKYFSVMMVLISGFCWHEYLSFTKQPKVFSEWVSHYTEILIGVLPALCIFQGLGLEFSLALFAVLFQGAVIWLMINKAGLPQIMGAFKKILFGIFYITIPFTLLVVVQSKIAGGKEAVWFLLLIVGAADTGAYFVGSKFGRTPFFSHLSPKKTREGLMGGLICAAIVGSALSLLLPRHDFFAPHFLMAACLAIALGLAAAFGDLFESMLKRVYGVKDSSNWLPGHGGFLDRFDGVMFAVIPLFFFMVLRGGFR